MNLILALFLTFLFGGIPMGYLIGKAWKGIDLREHGSKNIGATNAGRVMGWRIGFIVLALDALKGSLPVLAAGYVESSFATLQVQILLGSIAILGHTFTPFLRFKGGKGVATALGVYLVLVPWVTVCAVSVFLVVYKWSGFVSLGSLVGSFVMPVWYFTLHQYFQIGHFSLLMFWVLVGTFVLIVVLHRENIIRMWTGKELKPSNAK